MNSYSTVVSISSGKSFVKVYDKTGNEKRMEILTSSEIKKIYETKGTTPDKKKITYCDTGVLAAHSWFVMEVFVF